MNPSPLTTAATLAGGLGLFLLGMGMMTDGLKLAAGPALERVLAQATRTRLRALAAGIGITAVVQSSSAVTVAAIGFVNAGLLGLGGALWVLFGSNVGTTMTGWLVALVGLKFKVEVLALPLVGVGAALRLTGAGRRRGAVGSALAGFGLLFLGLSMIQGSFAGLAERVSLPQGTGPLAVIAQLGVGILMTVLMQSSSASMAVALTAAQGGLLTPQGAAAVVIGANLGTTVTALLAALGATANAKRAALAHVLFNGLTGAVALALLPWLVGAIAVGRETLGLPPDPAAKLALFHTAFNVMGLLLMWPLAGRLTRFLAARFRRAEEDEAQPRFLDQTVLAVPALALDALARELDRLGVVVRRALARALDGASPETLESDRITAEGLEAAVGRFVEGMNRQAMGPASSTRLPVLLRVARYHDATLEQALTAAALQAPEAGLDTDLEPARRAFLERAHGLLEACELTSREGSPSPEARLAEVASAYQDLKRALLLAGSEDRLSLGRMEEHLRWASLLHRGLQQAEKAVRHATVAGEASRQV